MPDIALRISHKKATALYGLGPPSTRGERPLGRSQRLRLTEMMDLIVHRATTERELTKVRIEA